LLILYQIEVKNAEKRFFLEQCAKSGFQPDSLFFGLNNISGFNGRLKRSPKIACSG
jgi:hypothetical protein